MFFHTAPLRSEYRSEQLFGADHPAHALAARQLLRGLGRMEFSRAVAIFCDDGSVKRISITLQSPEREVLVDVGPDRNDELTATILLDGWRNGLRVVGAE